MSSQKETKRVERQKLIESLLNDHDIKLDQLVEATKKKHENGGLIKDPDHYTRCIRAFTEEELDA